MWFTEVHIAIEYDMKVMIRIIDDDCYISTHVMSYISFLTTEVLLVLIFTAFPLVCQPDIGYVGGGA